MECDVGFEWIVVASVSGLHTLDSVANGRFLCRTRYAGGEHGSTGLERLVVTDLGGGFTPLIRFDTGDLVRRDLARAGKPIVQVCGEEVAAPQAPAGSYVSPYAQPVELDRMTGIDGMDDIGQAMA